MPLPKIQHLRQIAYFCITALLVSGCSTYPAKHHVSGSILGSPVNTKVDSKLAKYYVEGNLGNRATPDAATQTEIKSIQRTFDSKPLSRTLLSQLAKETSVDFSAIYFARRVNLIDSNSGWTEYQKYVSSFRKSLPVNGVLEKNVTVMFVPGWFYHSNPETGADFAKQRALLDKIGIKNKLIPTKDNGTVQENAVIVADEIRSISSDHKIILVSASKGGPEVHETFGRILSTKEKQKVVAWISVGGVLKGSRLADWACNFPSGLFVESVFFFKGMSTKSIGTLKESVLAKQSESYQIPSHIFAIAYVGVPLSGQVSERARSDYVDLRELGPNDGLTPLADELIPNGLTIAELGLDHFYSDPEIDIKSLALLALVQERLNKKR